MSKAKNAPKKEVLALGNTSLSTVGEFIPVFRKKRNKKQITTKRAVQSYPLILVSEEQKQYYLGKITVGSTSNILPETFELCRISFKHSKEDSIEIILTCGNTCIVIRSWNSGSFLKDAVQTKMFSFDISTQGEIVYFKLYLISIPLPKFYPKIGKCIKAAFALFYDINTNLDIETNQTKTQVNLSNIELKDLYEKIVEKREGCEHFENEILCIPQLKPKLRKYQEQAVNWMIYRETIANDLNGNIHPLYQKITLKSNIDIYLDKYTGWIEKTPPIIQCKWKGGILADEMGLGKTVEIFALILKNKMNKDTQTDVKLDVNEDTIDADSNDTVIIIKRQLKKRKSIEEDDDDYRIPEKMKKVPEPTRGKSSSFQALQSIYNHTLSEYCTTKIRKEPEEYRVQCICGSTIEDGSVECEECGKWQHSACLGWKRHLGEYKCPQCWETSELLQTKATLIVVPSSLRKQWCREMKTHLKAGLKVLNYEGYAATPAYPTELLEYDIVITTYNVLQAEMRLTETSPYINLRKQRKYWPSGSPLVRMYWWRLCLDEAQTVETPGRMVSLMARKISACHRWAVTGTPIARGLTDIYGLIDYLKIEPYCDYDTWKNILYDPYLKGNQESMYNFLSKVLWRTSKNSVLDQINIPKQTHELHLLEFSAVEKFFYNREHEICAQQFLKVASNFDSNLLLEKMDKSDLKNLMNPLLSLRQACSDPSTVRGKGRYVSLKKNTSSMKDLLEALILKNRHDCEESLRLMVSSINGLAGIYLLMDTPEEAIKEYRKVLQLAARFSVEKKKGKLTIDKLPLIHTMYNLAEVLEKYPSSEHTLRDTTLREDCADLEKQYIEKFMKEVNF